MKQKEISLQKLVKNKKKGQIQYNNKYNIIFYNGNK